MISVKNLVAEYPGRRVLHNVSFELKPNTITALVGPNGAGKTTLLMLLAGLEESFSGSIHIDGIDIDHYPREVHKILGFLPDFFGLYSELTVLQCLEYAACSHKINQSLIPKRIEDVLTFLHLVDYKHVKTAQLSRGLKQRVAIAQTIIFKPKILLLDEPASGLDPESRIMLSKLLLDLRDQGMTLLVSSHILSELEEYCEDMLIIRDGRLYHHTGKTGSSSTGVLTATFSNTEYDKARLEKSLMALANITNVEISDHLVEIHFSVVSVDKAAVLKILMEHDLDVTSFTQAQTKLQDVYMQNIKSN